MIEIVKSMGYRAFGLNVFSEISLPELTNQFIEDENGADVVIVIEDVSNLWYELSSQKKKLIIKENIVMFQIDEIAIFSIQEGNKIVVSQLQDYDEDIIRLYLLGTCMGTLLMQRKILPLHGSAIAINGTAFAFVGDSGAGKSTLASAFLKRGFQLLSDDVIAISFSKGKNTPIVIPSYPQQKLWQQSLNEFGMESRNYKSIYGRETKYSVPVTSYLPTPLPLGGVFELVKFEGKEIEINPIEKLKRFQTLFGHTYRNFLIPGLGLLDWHFRNSVNIINQVEIYNLRRPKLGFSANQLAMLILDIIKKGGIDNDKKSIYHIE